MIVSYLPLKDCTSLALTATRLYEATRMQVAIYNAIAIKEDTRAYCSLAFGSCYLEDNTYHINLRTFFNIKTSGTGEGCIYKRLYIRGIPSNNPDLKAFIKKAIEFLRGINTTFSSSMEITKITIDKMFAKEKIDIGARIMRFAIISTIDWKLNALDIDNELDTETEELARLVKSEFVKEEEWYVKRANIELVNAIPLNKLQKKKSTSVHDAHSSPISEELNKSLAMN
jgi:hypothetical protein